MSNPTPEDVDFMGDGTVDLEIEMRTEALMNELDRCLNSQAQREIIAAALADMFALGYPVEVEGVVEEWDRRDAASERANVEALEGDTDLWDNVRCPGCGQEMGHAESCAVAAALGD